MQLPAIVRRRRVLLVDDDEDIRELLTSLFEAEMRDVDVVAAASADEALATLRAGRFDLILTDHRMPGKSGMELLARAREQAPQTPRVMLTAHADLALAMQAVNEQGAERFLTKPVDPRELVRFVREILLAGRASELREGTLLAALGVADE